MISMFDKFNFEFMRNPSAYGTSSSSFILFFLDGNPFGPSQSPFLWLKHVQFKTMVSPIRTCTSCMNPVQ